MNIISSKNNNKIKFIKKIRDNSSFRKEMSLAYLEGERLVVDTPINLINEVYISENYNGKLPIGLSKESKNVFVISNEVFDIISDTVNSSGIIALSNIINGSIDNIINSKYNLILVLNSIKDPGNMGTIIRTAESAGVNAIIIDKNSVDIYSPKVVRSSMSSLFRMNIYKTDDLESTINELKKANYFILGTSLNASNDYVKYNYNKNTALVIGSESSGISENILNLCDDCIKINMCGEIESLNAAIATGIILFEMKRRREEEND